MSSVSPRSSPPTKSLGSTSSLSQSSPHLLSPQLPYRRFIQASESPSNKQYYQKASLLRPSSPIAPLNGLEAAFLVACDEAEEDAEDFVADLLDEPSEFIGNQAFIEEGFESDSEESESDEGIVGSSNENSEESHFASNEEQPPGPASRRTGSQSIRNAWISDCSTENAKLKLIRILKGKALVPKQR